MTFDDETKQVAQQAEKIVQALDAYLATFPWPAPTVQRTFGGISAGQLDQRALRMQLIEAIGAALIQREPRMNDLQRMLL